MIIKVNSNKVWAVVVGMYFFLREYIPEQMKEINFSIVVEKLSQELKKIFFNYNRKEKKQKGSLGPVIICSPKKNIYFSRRHNSELEELYQKAINNLREAYLLLDCADEEFTDYRSTQVESAQAYFSIVYNQLKGMHKQWEVSR